MATTFAEYLNMYQESWLRLQQMTPRLLSYEDRALYSIWGISYEQVKRQNEKSAMLLRLWAYFDNQDVWLQLLQEGHKSCPAWFRELTDDALSFNEAVRVLCNYSLVEADTSSGEGRSRAEEYRTESRGYSMHGCVHKWTMYVLNEERNHEMAQLAIRCVGAHVPGYMERVYWAVQQRLMRHAGRCLATLKLEEPLVAKGDEWALNNLAHLYQEQGRLSDSETLFKLVLEGFEKTLGPEHILTLNTVNNLGVVYAAQRRLTDAEPMYKRILQGYEKTLGPEDISTLRAASNLGNLYATQGRLTDAEPMYERVLQGYEKALGPERVDSYVPALNTIQNLADLYVRLNRVSQARALYTRYQAGIQSVFGAQHDRYQEVSQKLASFGGPRIIYS